MNEKEDKIEFPKVKNVSPKSLADDIFPYIPGDEKNEAVWKKLFKDMYEKIAEDFKKAGKQMPMIKIIHDKKPLRETDHSLLKPLKNDEQDKSNQ